MMCIYLCRVVDVSNICAYALSTSCAPYVQINIASRFHFQILFVDNDNFSSHIAECIIQNIIEYNDALCTLFPESATIQSTQQLEYGGEAVGTQQQQSYSRTSDITKLCNTLGLSYCTTTDDTISPYFDLTLLDKYDLVISMNEDVQSKIVRSLPVEMNGYEQKCRLLSEFLSMDFFCSVNNDHVEGGDSNVGDTECSTVFMNMIPSELLNRVEPYNDQLKDKLSTSFQLTDLDMNEPRMVLSNNGAMIPNPTGFHPTISSLIVACTGLTKFCLDTMDRQFDVAFQTMLNLHFKELSDLEYTLEEADAQLRRGGQGVSGYFSPEQRMERIERHMTRLRLALDE